VFLQYNFFLKENKTYTHTHTHTKKKSFLKFMCVGKTLVVRGKKNRKYLFT